MKRDNETKTGRMPILWGLVAVMGLFLAVCVKDGSQCELGMRAAGVAFFAAGAYMGGWLSLNEPEQDEQKEKKSNN